MAIRRTKEQKKKAQQLRTAAGVTSTSGNEGQQSRVAYTFSASSIPSAPQAQGKLTESAAQFVAADLVKTAVTAGLLFVVLVGIYFYLRYN